MRSLIKVFRYLGSIYFAILLIASTAAFVVAGTFLESWTSSHRFAAHFTYGHPLFIALLWGFFLNILVSALHRWPFKAAHIPFLTTHLGLLMILGGMLTKSYFGTQGHLLLVEGGGSNEIFLPNTYALQVIARDGRRDEISLSSKLYLSKGKAGALPELDVQLVSFAPHSLVVYESWIKNDEAFIQGFKPFAVHPLGSERVSSRVKIEETLWNLVALRSEETFKALPPHLATPANPTLALIDDPMQTTLIALHQEGEFYRQCFSKEFPSTMAVYDQGFGGYYAFAAIPKNTSKAYSTYAKAFGIAEESMVIESPLDRRCIPHPPSIALEKNRPQITLRVRAENHIEFVTLPFEPRGSGIRWPVLGGRYLFRFQPESRLLPYRLRLRQARQMNYPLSAQPFSYESDLLITSLKDGSEIEQTLSMNHVHETWEGYRFYLSNIVSSGREEGEVNRVQIVVNHDPAKYGLTYPGAIILSLGIFLLFWMRPYASRSQP